jgi:MFS family permease
MDDRAGTRTALSLTVTAGGTLLALLVFTAPLSIVPAVADGLHAGTVATSWILNSMSLGLAIALLTAGAIGDDFGRRRVFTWGAAVLAAGSALCGVAPNALTFVAGRVVEGIGAAAVIACGLALISHTFPPGPGRAHATGIWGACLGAGIAAGPVVGSIVDTVIGWRYTYAIITVVAIGLAAAGRFWLQESHSGRVRKIDVAGSALLGAGLGCLLAALTEGRQGWTSPLELSLIAGAVVFLLGFTLHQRQAADPMLDLSLFQRPALLSATIAAFVTGAGVTALMAFLSTVLERGMSHSPVAASMIMLAWSATSVVSALLTRRIPQRFSGSVRMSGGLVGVSAGLIPLTMLTPHSPTWQLVIGLLVSGAGTGVVNASLGREAVASVPVHLAGTGSGINNTSRYVGAALGVTVVTIIAVQPGPDPVGGLVAGWNVATVVGIALSLSGAAVVFLFHRADTKRTAGERVSRKVVLS